MTVKQKVKTVGSFIMDVLEVVSPVVVTGLFITKPSKYKSIITYGDVINAVNNSSLWSDGKAKVISVLPMYQTSDFYKAVISIVKSSMWSDDKVNLIIEMCKKVES